MIEISHLKGGYRGKPILQDLSLTISQGEIVTLVGPNGCGKTTLLKTIARLLPFQGGSIRIQGKDLSRYTPKELARVLSILPQSRNTPPITVEQLVLHGRFPYLGFACQPGKEDRERAEEAMERAGILPYRERDLRELSGGERQKAYLAMVIAQDTPLILLDEPTTYLDIDRQFEILELVQDLNRQGKTLVMVLHDLGHALEYSHRIGLMQKGELVGILPPRELFDSGLLGQVFQVKGYRVRQEGRTRYYFAPHDKN